MIVQLLLVFITDSSATGSLIEPMARALSQAMASDVRLSVRPSAAPPDDAMLAEEAAAAGALAAVRLLWLDPDRMSLHVRVVGDEEAHERVLVFARSDPAAERGRTVGFVLASYLRPPPATSSEAPAETAHAVHPQPPMAVAAVAGTPPPARQPRWSVEAFGDGSLPLDGAGGVGGGLAARWWQRPGWGLRAGLVARGGSVGPAESSSVALALSAGAFKLVLGSPSGPSCALRADALLLRDTLTHFSSDDPRPVTRGRLLGALDQGAELSWPLSPFLAVHFAALVEEASGATAVFLHDRQVAQIGAWRAVAELGFLARF